MSAQFKASFEAEGLKVQLSASGFGSVFQDQPEVDTDESSNLHSEGEVSDLHHQMALACTSEVFRVHQELVARRAEWNLQSIQNMNP